MDYHTDNLELNTELEKKVASLPPALQELIKSTKVEDFVSSVAARNSLSETEEEGVLRELALIFMKFEPVEAFLSNLLSEALVPPDAAKEIAIEATEEFFTPFAEHLTMPSAPAVTTPSPSIEKPYVEAPVKKASYNAILDVPNYSAPPTVQSVPATPTSVPFIPVTPAISVQPTFEAPTTSPRAPQKILPAENRTPPQAQ